MLSPRVVPPSPTPHLHADLAANCVELSSKLDAELGGLELRPARAGDLDGLLTLERRCFDGDRLSRRSFRHLLSRGHASVLVAERRGRGALLGYALTTLRTGTRQARLYSIGVDPDARQLGLARRLLQAAEQAAREVGCETMRLEVRIDNLAAIGLYRSFGYHEIGLRRRYYEDGASALCMAHQLEPHPRGRLGGVLVIVDRLEDWRFVGPQVEVMTANAYLDAERRFDPATQIINLCRSLRYQGRGYYCSLLAEARGQRVMPSAQSHQDLGESQGSRAWARQLDAQARAHLRGLSEAEARDAYDVDVMFGETREPALAGLARALFEASPAPLLHVQLRRRADVWRVARVSLGVVGRLPAADRERFATALHDHVARGPRPVAQRRAPRYRLALLVDPDDPTPPSTDETLARFIAVGDRLDVACELLTPREAERIEQFDALFIRTTTAVNHYTYRPGERAGLVVIDDPQSIVRCTNKVYQHELFRHHAIPTPKSVVFARGQLDRAEQLGYPLVIKAPDGSSSRAVHKAEDRAALERHCAAMFEGSELLLAQEFTYTEFDWRIGVLARRPLYAAQYFMAEGHWQVIDCASTAEHNYGATRTLAVELAPPEVIETAVRAANLIGDGFYGVDLKQTRDGRVVVIEVNDNPNVDLGGEDQVLGDRIFERIIAEFRRRLDLR